VDSSTRRKGELRLALKMLLAIVLVLAASLSNARHSVADELLRVDGRAVKWGGPALGPTTIITYAILTRPFSLPDATKTLSPDNCGAMGAFEEIVVASSNLTGAGVKEELLAAFASWENVADVKFSEIDEVERANVVVGATIASSGPAFANLSIGRGVGRRPIAKGLGSGIGTMPVTANNIARGKSVAAIERAYICLSPKQPWKIGFDGNLGVYDLRHTFMHEIGHAIGLDHPGSSGAIMGYRYDEKVPVLQPSDIAAARFLYGQPPIGK
jgi:hypothetical protein